MGQYGFEIDDNDLNKVEKIAHALYLKYGGGIKDGKHIAHANLAGVNCFLSQDPGLLRYPGVNVYGASRSLLAHVNINQNPANIVNLEALISDEGAE